MHLMREIQEISSTSFGYKIFRYNTLSSTNEKVKEIAKETPGERIVVTAETQTQGRGRLAREWLSPQGGLWFSVLLRPQIKPKEATRLTFIMSLAVAETIRILYSLATEVKWPNDIHIKGKKVCGILTETTTQDGILKYVVVGVGLNVNVDLDAFPENLQINVTTLKRELDCEVDIKTLMQKILQLFEEKYLQLLNGHWSSLLKEWKAYASFLGKLITVTSFDETFKGKALDVNQDGVLLVKINEEDIKQVIVGDIAVEVQS